jgi:predicted HicB family RNase H-like nuclease
MSKRDDDRLIAVTKRGTKITEKGADELAAEAERGYDLSRGRRRGRPSLDAGISPRVTFRITGQLQERARKRADSEGKTLSELAREALEQYVK